MLDSSRKETPSSAVLSLTLICALLLVGLLHSALSLPALLASAFGGLAVMLFLRYRHLERELRQLRQRELERADPGGDPLAQARNCCKTYEMNI